MMLERTIGITMVALGLLAGAATPAGAESPVAEGAGAEIVSQGHFFTEGPATDAEGRLYFSDVPRGLVHRLEADGELTKVVEESKGVNGLYFDAEGRLFGCQGTGRAIVEIDPETGEMTSLADAYEGKRFNSPNDLWIDAKGGIYFTDPRYGNRDGMELDGEYVFYLSPDRTTLTLVADGFDRPNGVIGTADGKTLYIADHGAKRTYRFSIQENGSLADRSVFIAEQGSDGMTLDERGNLYLTNEHVDIYSPEGEHLGRIEMPIHPTNLTFGGPDGTTLYVTARMRVYAVAMSVRGQ